MKIAIDVSPLESGHKVRGVGFYLKHLKNALQTYFPNNTYIFFPNQSELDSSIDVVHYPYFDPFFITIPYQKRAKTVVTVHDLTPLVFPHAFPSGLKGTIKWHLQKLHLRRVDRIITDSVASRTDIIRIAGVPREKIDVVYLAAGEEFKQLKDGPWKKEIKEKYGLPDAFVLYVGDVTWNKNLPRLLEALNQTDIPLVMVGKALTETDFDRTNPWNADRIRIEELASESKNIYRLGFLPTEDLIKLYNAATVFIMPSVYEGFGLPVLEAMQCGTPVVTGTGGSLKEVAGEGAYLVNSTDVKSIRDGVETVFHSQTLQQELRKKGFEQAKKFTWKKTAEGTMKAYEK